MCTRARGVRGSRDGEGVGEGWAGLWRGACLDSRFEVGLRARWGWKVIVVGGARTVGGYAGAGCASLHFKEPRVAVFWISGG